MIAIRTALVALIATPALAAAPGEKAADTAGQPPLAALPIQPYSVTDHAPLERATGWLGRQMLSADGQPLGPVEELILGEGGELSGVLIAMGGVLGFGATAVFLPFDAISIATPEDGPPELRAAATAEEIARLVETAQQ